MRFLVIDANGKPLVNWPYAIEMNGTEQINGQTDSEGETEKIHSNKAESVKIHIYEPAVTPINPQWDL
ncbi:MAG: hypothetical protein P4L77_05165 [Sulfuriferula sp.]|nr:hypothetical protein [Sulfuriferula sp.]